MDYKPPYVITSSIIDKISKISETLGQISTTKSFTALRLRRINRIKTIQGSLAIEGNTLNENQIKTIIEGKTVIAPPKEIQEVRNAIKVYDHYLSWRPSCEADLLTAHKMLMAGLLDKTGQYRKKGAGVMGKERIIHIAPPAERVPFLMKNLLNWLKKSHEHPLIASSVFHYEFEFIHPFEDGNGRIGRLWQNLILSQWNDLFSILPLENMVYRRQQEYYKAINLSSEKGESTPFISFMLETIFQELLEATQETTQKTTQEKILMLIREKPEITRNKMAEEIGLSADGIKYHLSKMRKQGMIIHRGSTKKGYWEILKED